MGPVSLKNGSRVGFLLALAALLLTLTAGPGAAAVITGYSVISKAGTDFSGRELWATRSFLEDGVPHLLAVDPRTFRTYDLPAVSFRAHGSVERFRATPFGKSLAEYTAAPYHLQNQGATHAEAGSGVCLTVDLCPSKRPFEWEMFDQVAALDQKGPVPVAIAISGAWLKNHPQELAYLKAQSARGTLAITWVNHSLHHPYDPKLPLAGNFLLTPGTDFDREVLEVEVLLLSEGLVPSPFFRFPGLVADQATVRRLRELSLIPLGSNAWLAKGEKVEPGSFILVHGNGNEPKGIKLLLPMLKRLTLRPLSEALSGRLP
ncbi:polysaccharide deacetylase family protein [Geomesophilobacter sediminis]|uniref:Polysaccharide deacetylase n=1 Tax=Geomesophilobacter sediminis TaxID=2798584 RepID=A0A8J7S6U4_9BACT|nr:polysaccharide deacetylase [Geomesophilobacter sediminis]MBJ6726592.1 polysaccharide deacetylase [Geomesophilobacter sediminis]